MALRHVASFALLLWGRVTAFESLNALTCRARRTRLQQLKVRADYPEFIEGVSAPVPDVVQFCMTVCPPP